MNTVIHKGKRMVPAFGIPYAEQVRVLGQWSAICPRCKRAIALRKRSSSRPIGH